ncbi:MAG: trypsin-like peptidase domain-containing protein [Gemmataceae bacterium]|nr:trypsin-like peptidase domain-containing protein [Gemmataceae bacterium]
MKCPKCAAVFTWTPPVVEVIEEEFDVKPATPDAPREKPGPREAKSRSVADDAGDDLPAPTRSRREKTSRREADSPGKWIGITFGLFALILIVGIGGGVLLFNLVEPNNSKDRGRRSNIPNIPLPGGGGGERPLLFAGVGAGERTFGERFNASDVTPVADDGASRIKFAPSASVLALDSLFPGGPAQPVVAPQVPAARKGGGEPPRAQNLAPATLERVKRATTFIRVIRGGGQDGTGSGFFVGPGIVMTNAHVLGMLDPNAAKPRRIELVLNSGEAEEAKYPGEVLAVDRENDLALLRISAEGNPAWPQPLTIVDGSSLIETQPVFIFGFPLGSTLGKAITVAESRVSSLRRDATGALNRIQVNGGMHPGNSGGPVVDAEGNVVGVAVSIIRDTSINFAVSGERANRFLGGHVKTLALGMPQSVPGGGTSWEVTAELSDPLGQVKKVAVDWWWGEPTERIAAGRGQNGARNPGRQTVELVRDESSGDYRGKIEHAGALPVGRVLWLQVRHEDAQGEAFYETKPAEPFSAPEPKTVQLRYRPRAGSHPVAVVSASDIRIRDADGDPHWLRVRANVACSEKLLGRDSSGGWVSAIGVSRLDVQLKSDETGPQDLGVDDHAEHLPKVRLELRTDATGRVTGGRTSLTDLPDEARGQLGSWCEEIGHNLAFVSVSFPEQELTPNRTWTDQRSLLFIGGPPNAEAQVRLTYRYLGVVRRDDREFALVQLTGEAGPNPNLPTLNVKASGQLLVDRETGVVADAFVRILSNVVEDDLEDAGAMRRILPFRGEGTPMESQARIRRQ